MKKLKIFSTALLFSASLNATTIYYNGEGNDIGAWSIGDGSLQSSALREVHDDTLNSNVMEFTDGGIYRLRMPGENLFWVNTTERVLSFDMSLDSDFTVSVFVQTPNGLRQLFYNRLNINAGHHNNVANRNILCAIGHNRLFRVGAQNSGWGNNPQHRNNRNGWTRVTVDLEQQLRDTEPNNTITSVLSMRITGTAGRIDNVTLDRPNRVNITSTEDDWRLSPNTPHGGTKDSIGEGDDIGNTTPEDGEVVEFRGAVNSNSFTAGGRTGNNIWNDRVHDTIQWRLRTQDPYKFIVHVNTQNGLRDLVYHGGKRRADNDQWWLNSMDAIEERGLDSAHNEIYIGLGIRRHLGDASPDNNNDDIPDYDSGTGPTWQTFTRNLATDIAEFENGNRLIAVNGVTIIGTNSFEHNSPMIASNIQTTNVQLFTSIPPTTEGDDDSDGIATDLHTWRLRETSVRISFVDNANGEAGFRFINADTGEILGNQLPAVTGTGTSTIGQINGLTAGTTYSVRVETLFNDERESSVSEPITFTTTGDTPPPPPVETDEEATSLHTWRLRETSVRVSFVDNADGETGFRFINANTGATLGNQLPAVNGRGTSTIGQINGLRAGTTYRVLVHTLFNDGRDTAISQPITFTTDGATPPPPPPVETDEKATELHRWRVRDNSVRVSFKDNAEGEIGFRFINADTGVQLGNQLPATNGRGTSSIGQINGLTEGTTYRVRVQTLFNDGRATATSDTLEFRTTGNTHGGGTNSDSATNLHKWVLKATSVKISFTDNSLGEIGFKYVNEATGENMGNMVSASSGKGHSLIGKITGLTPSTTYRVRVHTLFNNGTATAISDVIEFTTPSR